LIVVLFFPKSIEFLFFAVQHLSQNARRKVRDGNFIVCQNRIKKLFRCDDESIKAAQ